MAKPLDNQNYYQILDVPYKATAAEIQRAYEAAKKLHQEDALMNSSPFDTSERGRILDKIEEAYQVLNNPIKRKQYNGALTSSIASSPLKVGNSQARSTQAQDSPSKLEFRVTEIVTGEMIKGLREKKGITLNEIADKTRINIDYLSAIEKNRFEALPAEVYVHSYVQQYLRIIHGESKLAEGYMRGYRSWVESRMPAAKS